MMVKSKARLITAIGLGTPVNLTPYDLNTMLKRNRLLSALRCSRASAERLENRQLLSAIGSFTVPSDGLLSAAVYRTDGTFVEALVQSRVSKVGDVVALDWDGKDQYGNTMPTNQSFQWKAVVSNVTGVNEGGVGNSGDPAIGVTSANSDFFGVANDPSGNLYSISNYSESGRELRKYAPDGTSLWAQGVHGGYGGLASDGTYVYVSRDYALTNAPGHLTAVQPPNDRVYRYYSASGNLASFDNPSDPNYNRDIAPNHNFLDFNVNRTALSNPYSNYPLRGLAVEPTAAGVASPRLWVSNYLTNQLEVVDLSAYSNPSSQTTSNPAVVVGTLNVSQPLGVAVQSVPIGGAPGVIWVASGSSVLKYTYTVNAGVYAFTPATGITGLNGPYGVTIGGPNGNLFITENGNGVDDIRQYDISGAAPTLTGLNVFGAIAVPGPVTTNGFVNLQNIAVDSNGLISVADHGNKRVQRFSSNGTIYGSIFSDFQPGPSVDKVTATTHRLMTDGWEFEVRNDGVPQPGWMGDGTWRLAGNWNPQDGHFGSVAFDNSIRRTFTVNGQSRDYIYFLGGDWSGAAIYQVGANGTGERRSVVLGTQWMGLDDTRQSVGSAPYVITDKNGDGVLTSNEVDATGQPPSGSLTAISPGVNVDAQGNIWFANYAFSVAELPLDGFDSVGNPIYNWSHLKIMTPQDTSYDGKQIAIGANGDIYQLGVKLLTPGDHHTPESSDVDPGGAYGIAGTSVRHYSGLDGSGQLVEVDSRHFDGHAESTAIAVSQNGNFLFSAINTGYAGGRIDVPTVAWIDVYDSNNLRIATLTPGPVVNYETGTFDIGSALTSFDANGKTYVYGEEVFYGKSNRWRLDNTSNLQYFGQGFAWPIITPDLTVSATTAAGSELTQTPGVFQIQRTSTASALTVNYTLAGTAQNGVDYSALPGSVTFAAGQSVANVTVSPLDDLKVDGTETVLLSLSSGSGYAISTSSNALVTIADKYQPTVSITASNPTALKSPNQPGSFTITRNSTAGNLTVTGTLGGTATNLDYLENTDTLFKDTFDQYPEGVSLNGRNNWVNNSNQSTDVIQSALAKQGKGLNVIFDQGVMQYPNTHSGPFAPSSQYQNQTASFDFYFPQIGAVSHGFAFNGPDANESVFLAYGSGKLYVYGGSTQGPSTTGLQAGQWYHLTADFNFGAAKTVTFNVSNSTFAWNSGAVALRTSGGVGFLQFTTASDPRFIQPYYVDNVEVTADSLPTGSFSVVIPDGQNSVVVPITPTMDNVLGNETVQLTLASSGNYILGTSSATVTITDTQPLGSPIAPSVLTATAASSSQINLNWTDNSSNETGFKVERATDVAFTQNLTLVTTTPANTNGYSDTGLSPSTAYYYYRVRATNAVGDSANSNIASAVTPASFPAPSGLIAIAPTFSQVNLTWTDNSSDETGFKIDRATDTAFTQNLVTSTVAANVTSYSSAGLIANTRYYFRVRATKLAGDSTNSNTAYATTPVGLAAAPSALAATTVSASQINLNWTDNSNNETGFKIERATDIGFTLNLTLLTTTIANVTSYNDTGLPASSTYFYRVRATNAAGDSGNSAIATAITSAASADILPSAYLAGSIASYSANIGPNYNEYNLWDNNTQTYMVASGSGPRFTMGLNASFTLGSMRFDFYPGQKWNSFTIYTNNSAVNPGAYNFAAWGTAIYTASNFTPVPITVGSNSYNAFSVSFPPVLAKNIRIDWHEAVPASGVLSELEVYAVSNSAPPIASGLTAATASPSQINLTWNDNSNNETGFKIERATDIAFTQNLMLVTTTPSNTTTYSDIGLSSTTTYYYRVRATNAAGDSANSNIAAATTTGSSILTVNFDAQADPITLSSSGGVITLTQAGSSQNYSGIQNIIVNGGGSVGDVLKVLQLGSGYAMNINSGWVTLAAPTSGTGVTAEPLGSLRVTAGAHLLLAPPMTPATRAVLILASLTIDGSGGNWLAQLDLNGNDLNVQGVGASGLGTIMSELKDGYNITAGGQWDGLGISSSAVALDSTHLTSLGVLLNSADGTNSGAAIYGTGSPMGLFDGTNPSNTDVLIKFTYIGDANLDGKVDGSDYSRIDNGFNTEHSPTPATGWANGDFNYDGVIDGSDYTLIDNGFNIQGASLTSAFSALVAPKGPTLKSSFAVASSEIESSQADLRGEGYVRIPAARKQSAILSPLPTMATGLSVFSQVLLERKHTFLRLGNE